MLSVAHISPPTLWVVVLLVLIASRALYRYFSSPNLPYPPGPPRDPIIGNLRGFPIEYQEKTFAQWANKYGTPPVPQLASSFI
jgi:hypothetical protein